MGQFHFYDRSDHDTDFSAEILAGLSASPRTLSPKFFYDERGSELFTAITQLPEYYLTRTEISLLRKHAGEISELVGDDFLLIEYGSGSSEKIAILLENLRPSIYAPLDISREYLAQSAAALGQAFPWLDVHATCIDFTTEFELPFQSDKRRVSFFPGSSIGNFSRQDALEFLARIRGVVGSDGGLLLGVDLKKDHDLLNAAYNDSQGVTRDFNLNILGHINREYGADFNLAAFDHHAFYNESEGCIQMFLVSKADQVVTVDGMTFEFAEGERIHTENSHKYTIDEVRDMATRAGFSSFIHWVDDQDLFGIFYLS